MLGSSYIVAPQYTVHNTTHLSLHGFLNVLHIKLLIAVLDDTNNTI